MPRLRARERARGIGHSEPNLGERRVDFGRGRVSFHSISLSSPRSDHQPLIGTFEADSEVFVARGLRPG